MKLIFLIPACLLFGCDQQKDTVVTNITKADSVKIDTGFADNPEKPGLQLPDTVTYTALDANKVPADSILAFAQTLIGVPYLYASMDPQKGFDCSGFINYVFNHFKIKVPRSSRDFENFGLTIPLPEIKRGDIILFTGTDSTVRIIGHIGIVISVEKGEVKFIHSTSGKAYGVAISSLDQYYMRRFMRVLHIPEVQ